MKVRDPKTAAEWQEAVNAAKFCLIVDAARQYGLVNWSAEINTARCSEILILGREKGFMPARTNELIRMFMERV